MENNLDYVEWIQKNKILIISKNKDVFLKTLGANRKFFNKSKWALNYKDDSDLAKKLMLLRDAEFMFAGGNQGWEPISIFCYLREKKLVTGEAIEIVWKGINKPTTYVV